MKNRVSLFILSAIFPLFTLLPFSPINAQVLDEGTRSGNDGSLYRRHGLTAANPAEETDPMILDMVSRISPDSIKATLRWLQNMGTRFCLADTKKEVANLLVGKFKSLGFADSEIKLDSFLLQVSVNINGLLFQDSSYQYNVVCTYQGTSAPSETYVIGGHYDSFCFEHSYDTAPGVDDNGTAVAATFEIARVMKLMNFHPEATIRFSLFAAEELGLFGSGYQAQEARANNEDIRFMLNMDMIGNNPDSIPEIKIYRYLFTQWAGDYTADCFTRYSGLNVRVPSANIPSGTDSYSYWMQGFPVTSLEETAFSPNWHQLSDTVGNCNMEYCAEVTRGACAAMLEQQTCPLPHGLKAVSSEEPVLLHWKPTNNARIIGYNVYRGDKSTPHYIRINESGPVTDSLYRDPLAETGKSFYYQVRSVNDSLRESFPSEMVCGTRYAFNDTLLVISCMTGTETTPDSIRNFYEAALDTIPFRWFDNNTDHRIDLGTLSGHQNVMWLVNTPDCDPVTDTVANYLWSFFANGGNILMTGFTPSHYFDFNTAYPEKTPEYSQMRNFFQVDTVNRKVPCFMFRANPALTGYDTLRIDPEKYTQANYPGEIHNLEVFTPTEKSSIIYRLDSHYASTSPLGSMKGKAVGIEYAGDVNTAILLSFPLFYLDTADAKNLIRFVMKEKFSHPTTIRDLTQNVSKLQLQNIPNPFTGSTAITFALEKPSPVNLTVHDMTGKMVAGIVDQKLDPGDYRVVFTPRGLPPGAYLLVLRTAGSSAVRTMILKK